MSCSIIYRCVGNVVNTSRKSSGNGKWGIVKGASRAPNGLEIITLTFGVGHVVNTLGVERYRIYWVSSRDFPRPTHVLHINQCEMGNVVNALDVACSIASRGIVSGNFAKQMSL